MKPEELKVGALYSARIPTSGPGTMWGAFAENGGTTYVHCKDVLMYFSCHFVGECFYPTYDYLHFFLLKNKKVLMSEFEIEMIIKDRIA